MSQAIIYRSIALLTAVAIGTACGAKSKTPADVQEIFVDNNQRLPAQMSKLCKMLRDRKAEPNLQGVSLSAKECSLAGQSAQNLRDLVSGVQSFDFTSFDYAISQVKDNSRESSDDEPQSLQESDVLSVSTRHQIWLNASLLGAAARILAIVAKSKLSESPTKASIAPVNTDFLNGPAVIFDSQTAPNVQLPEGIIIKINSLAAPAVDLETKSLSLDLAILIDGPIKVSQDFRAAAQLLGNKVVVTVRSVDAKDFAQSIIRRVDVIVFAVPYANDVYVDVTASLEIHSLGLDSLVAAGIKKGLTAGLNIGLTKLRSLE